MRTRTTWFLVEAEEGTGCVVLRADDTYLVMEASEARKLADELNETADKIDPEG